MTDILFVTNRAPSVTPPQGITDFGDELLAAGTLWFGAATVSGINMHDPDAGTATIADLHWGTGFSPRQIATLTQSGNDIVVFVHGTDNDAQAAIQRAAYNKTWLEAVAPRGFDMIAFTWPARNYGSLDQVLKYQDDYHTDQRQADASAAHVDLFFAELYRLKPQLGNRKINLLCHSMGNRVLGGAVEAWYRGAAAPAPPLFDVALLAAADERADSFTQPNGGRLSNLYKLSTAITVYVSDADFLMAASDGVNGYAPMGLSGPHDVADRQKFPQAVYQFVDCTDVNDYVAPRLSLDLSHQYYRQSPTVRADIAATLVGAEPNRYYHDLDRNMWDEVMPPLPYPMV
jgi:esterase/lipase superfamily enzyme